MQTRFRLTHIISLVAILLAPALFAQTNPAASDDSIRKAVLETNSKMTQAADSMDVDAFFTYIVDSGQCVIIRNGTVFNSRQEAMEAVKRGFMGVAKIDRRFDNPQVTIISPDVALLAAEGSVSATLTDGRKMDSRFAVSLIFVRRDGEWKVLHGHYSMPARP